MTRINQRTERRAVEARGLDRVRQKGEGVTLWGGEVSQIRKVVPSTRVSHSRNTKLAVLD